MIACENLKKWANRSSGSSVALTEPSQIEKEISNASKSFDVALEIGLKKSLSAFEKVEADAVSECHTVKSVNSVIQAYWFRRITEPKFRKLYV